MMRSTEQLFPPEAMWYIHSPEVVMTAWKTERATSQKMHSCPADGLHNLHGSPGTGCVATAVVAESVPYREVPDLHHWFDIGAADGAERRRYSPPDLTPFNEILAFCAPDLRAAGKAYREGYMHALEESARGRLAYARALLKGQK